ncbi:MAG: type II toxin-antitoxin system VapC family toxin [Solirubrobacteraceae bacterium MAG38_C4-C5]|nr:type II toxin-antitoxin system VapC family toxin [Candidatus Siliceabacter maunaloa]
MLRFLDSSLIVRAYLPDEPGQTEAYGLLTGGGALASELAPVEVTRGLVGARRAGRLSDTEFEQTLAQVDVDLGEQGRIGIIPFDGGPTLVRARELVLAHRLRTLDAIHLAVADLDARRLAEPDLELHFLTRDADQAAAARALGLLTDP